MVDIIDHAGQPAPASLAHPPQPGSTGKPGAPPQLYVQKELFKCVMFRGQNKLKRMPNCLHPTEPACLNNGTEVISQAAHVVLQPLAVRLEQSILAHGDVPLGLPVHHRHPDCH